MYDLDKKEGNTGSLGRYFWRIENSNGTSALEKCLSWTFLNELANFSYWYDVLIKSDPEMACPCTLWQAWFDRGRFSWSWWYSWPEYCFESRRSKFVFYNSTLTGLVELRLRQECCYSTDWEDFSSLKLGPPDGGHLKVTAYYYSSNHEETFTTDEEAYKYCCVDVPRCDLFYRHRPSDTCSSYRPPIRRTCYCLLQYVVIKN